MGTWAEFAAAEPEMAALGRDLIRERTPAAIRRDQSFTGYAFLATTRTDGRPRVHPVCPVMVDWRLFVAIDPTSAKLRDLRREGAFLLQAFLGPADEEFSVQGRARESDDPATRARVVEAGRGFLDVRDEEVLFEFDIERADSATWLGAGTPELRAVRRAWRA